ncbi:rRNA processing protein gar2 [Penicillium lagena]|uniref:rRNA processing protein gar2 n=1 Tax=Penicillium lagena TaxID=94218 RepID=UPI002541B4B4|nr:rRNA processing protein gar2 [Penicillium lagena]KAJ5610237.1 rRNA processing protein gar2 [Penicillium lagena]
MAPDKKEKKRKAAPAAAELPAKKTKKADAKPAQTKDAAPKPALKKKENGTAPKTDASVKANGEPARQIKPRKRAADFLGDEENDEPAAPAPEKQAEKKKSKKEDTSKKAKKAEKVVEESDEEIVGDVISEPESGEDEDLDDQTAELIKGFESSGEEDASEDEGFNPDQPVPRIPDSKKAKRKILKKQKQGNTPSEPGTVYIGRIPHGFYEHQMRAYFSQFGDITRLRLSRNRLTGRSKHYAFVEFSSTTVAKIVAETMDNYLMYGHILKCKYVPAEQLHPEVWKGANRRFKKTPWNRIEKKRLEKGKTREQWSQRIEQEQKRRQAKLDKLKALGYEMDLPVLKSVDDVPVQEQKAVEPAPEEETVKAIEAPSAESEDTPKKKAAKGKKAGQGTPKQDAPSESPATKAKGKASKGSKTKAKA